MATSLGIGSAGGGRWPSRGDCTAALRATPVVPSEARALDGKTRPSEDGCPLFTNS